MKTADVLKSAIQNTFRSKLRTSLTVIAIFIGAFTLTITSAIGAGISNYIDNQLGAIGAEGVLTVTLAPDDAALAGNDGPTPYDPEKATAGSGVPGGGSPFGGGALSTSDIDAIEAIDGITGVEPTVFVTADFITTDGADKFEVTLNPVSAATVPDLAAGEKLSDGNRSEILLPDSFLDALGFADAKDAIGATATLGATDAVGEQHEVTAKIVGVQNASLIALGAGINEHLTDELVKAQETGRITAAPVGYVSAVAHFDPNASDEQVSAIKADLADQGFQAQTTEDQIGAFQTVISGIIGVLNAFAVIALIAAGFGIVNTLLMSVQERTREIGLMKAMGMSSSKVFGLFSWEAVFIGFLGSAIGAGVAILAGSAISSALANSLLSGLPGLHIMLFEPASIITVILVVMLIAFLAGTLPARRAAKQNPIDALRYE
ncbi:ABC transporter permease [Microbacterium sp. CH12i]|uniref:ABC transporter permease n=1 Tax=Microbacterium sp. CH12i TaxID=1479651 RepID=UPI000461B768|nr:ABC transporter permease [Microbacterium sp. CH12i]KDA04993.1 ABC transporter permease [Microbacterium sp. CH12i]